MKNRVLYFILTICLSVFISSVMAQKRKLVVGIVVDQMRPDYLYRYNERLSEDGFKRLLEKGFVAKNMQYNYVPTYTAPGHTSIYAGSTPAIHGIIANDWFFRDLEAIDYCAHDTNFQTVGSETKNGQMSPSRLQVTNLSDELLITSNFRSKVVGIALKDRSAIYPAGHQPTGAYWYDKKTGEFITSTYYMESLPQWLTDLNNRKLPDAYLAETWNTLYPIETYTASEADDQEYETILKGRKTATFPYDLKKLKEKNGGYNLLAYSPFGNTLTTEVAIAALKGEELGQDEFTDLLAISFSSTDYIGHAFGPQSVEVEDTYLRLDRDLARLFQVLDEYVGEGEYLVFLTADHACAEATGYMEKHHMPAGYYDLKALKTDLDAYLDEQLTAADWVSVCVNDQVFLNRNTINASEFTYEEVVETAQAYLSTVSYIHDTYSAEEIKEGMAADPMRKTLWMGYHSKRSGDILMLMQSGWQKKGGSVATHGSSYAYDRHVPFFLYGKGVPVKESVVPYEITDIAPTISQWLDIKLPSGCIGEPIQEVFE